MIRGYHFGADRKCSLLPFPNRRIWVDRSSGLSIACKLKRVAVMVPSRLPQHRTRARRPCSCAGNGLELRALGFNPVRHRCTNGVMFMEQPSGPRGSSQDIDESRATG